MLAEWPESPKANGVRGALERSCSTPRRRRERGDKLSLGLAGSRRERYNPRRRRAAPGPMTLAPLMFDCGGSRGRTSTDYRIEYRPMLILTYILATLAILLVAAGLVFATNRRRHVPLMIAAFVADMVGLVIVEFIIPAQTGKTDPVTGLLTSDAGWGWRETHAAFATLAVVGYVIQIVTGRKLLAGDRSRLRFHKLVARGFIVTRVLAYVTMYLF